MKSIKVIVHDHMDFSVNRSVLRQYLSSTVHSLKYSQKKLNLITVMKRKKNAFLFLKNKWFIPNGLSLERYVNHSMTREEYRNKIGVCDTDIVCLLLGWDLKLKGLDVALKAINICREKNTNIILGIIGAGFEKPTEDAAQFIFHNTGIDPFSPWIKYLSGTEDMFAVHKAIDVYISSSRREAFSYGLLEAISQETPVVVSNIPGTKWSEVYNNSYFYPVEDYHACSGAILCAIEHRKKVTNSQEVVQKYSIEKWCDNVMDVYKKVLEKL